ncbi:MAG: type III-A CRISPR-associated RAMP protein Csm4 [Euryarchaeota archaeon]|nr:type III-A CRISPR-associated RAMP protein Csm4 [Euryarchaeota archaeon]
MPKNLKIIKLNFTSPLHLGEIGIGLEESSLVLHSDTIFNAICNALAKLYGREWVTDFLRKFKKEPSFRISSGFPFAGQNLYFPKPMSRANINNDLLQDYSKKLKKTNYLRKDFFEKWIAEEELLEKDLKEITDNEAAKGCDEKDSGFGAGFLLPKVSISRESAESSIYFLGSVRFKEDSGIWFILDCSSKEYENNVISALRLLQHDGIGGKRTWGYGSFSLKEENLYLKLPDSDSHLLLSLFYPEESDDPELDEKHLFSGKNARWGFSLRGGYAYPYGSRSSSQKAQRLFIKEGSIFEKKPEGRLIEDDSDLEGIEKLYHYGFAYSIPISISRGEKE